MRLDRATWQEVESYLARSPAIIIPCGSTEQHGPMGLIGTDAICAERIAESVGEQIEALVAPTLAYTPAPFNMAFPGTISIPETVFEAVVDAVLQGLLSQGFRAVYFLNGHGANIAPLSRCKARSAGLNIRIRSWWDFAAVNQLREEYYGDWEGMHGTPSEIAITQATDRIIAPGTATAPPRKITQAFIKSHAGDRHGPPDDHRAAFPDGRVGSHSALAEVAHGQVLLAAAASAVSDDFLTLRNSSLA